MFDPHEQTVHREARGSERSHPLPLAQPLLQYMRPEPAYLPNDEMHDPTHAIVIRFAQARCTRPHTRTRTQSKIS
jgi:hypothetical protein